MTTSSPRDRRRERARGVRLGRSALLQIPARLAVPFVSLAAVLTAVVDHLSSGKIWFGPVYLLLSALAAWFVSSRFAIVLGLVVISFNLLTGVASTYPYGPNSFLSNFALRIFCVLVVALMLGLARKALEREWRLARTDLLTGALNRQAFFEAIKSDSGREGPAVLAFADVDGLKYLNDQMGHELGDEGLRNFADRVRLAIRKNDLFARMGGDEFVVFMKVKDEAAGKAVANRLNRVLNLEASADERTLKCSIGVLLLPAGSKSIDAELRLADKLMYVAKNAQLGLSAASATEVDGQTVLLSPLHTSMPNDRKGTLRARSRQRDCGVDASDSSVVEALAAA